MATQATGYFRYETGTPPRLEIWAPDAFRAETGGLCRQLGAQYLTSFSNGNEVLHRLASGHTLSDETFRQEGKAWAVRSGALRWYGAYSKTHPKVFVLSHVILKQRDKLNPSDEQRAVRCAHEFDCVRSRP